MGAPVPAFVTVSLKVQHLSADAAPSSSEIQQAVADRVNAIPFDVGRLSASVVHDAVHDISGQNSIVVSPLDFFVQIRRPDGTFITLRDADSIEVPYEPERGVSSRTTAFYLAPEDVDVAVETVPALPV